MQPLAVPEWGTLAPRGVRLNGRSYRFNAYECGRPANPWTTQEPPQSSRRATSLQLLFSCRYLRREGQLGLLYIACSASAFKMVVLYHALQILADHAVTWYVNNTYYECINNMQYGDRYMPTCLWGRSNLEVSPQVAYIFRSEGSRERK